MRPGQGTKLAIGLVLMVSFLAVLVAIFLPLVDGDNALDALDNLYNSISKASAYYIPRVQQDVADHPDETVSLALQLADAGLAERAAALLRSAAVEVSASGSELEIDGELSALLGASIEDADSVYHNNGEEVAARRGGIEARAALHTWWKVLSAVERELTRQRRFETVKLIHTVKTKAVECAYNYYGIDPQPISERWAVVLFSLVFYVVYTVWYGYAVMYLFEGLGYQLTAH